MEIKSILKVVSANLIVMAIGIVQIFLLPNILEPVEYGYWSLYVLYVSYAGFIIFGYCDGFYLKYGGKNYDDLDKSRFSAYYFILLVYVVLFFITWFIGIKFLFPNEKRSFILILVGVGGALACIVSYFTLLNQATSRFSIYAKGHVIEKLVIVFVASVCFIVPKVNAFYIIMAAIIGKALTLIYFARHSKDIILCKPTFNREIWASVIDNIKVGFTLTLSGVGSMLMTGFGRFVVENRLGIEELGYYSLMFSVAALFTQIIYAISTVFYPIFRRVNENEANSFLSGIDSLIINLGVSVLILYYPARYILEILFPKYSPAMECILYLFPIVIFQCRMSVVYDTVYKVFRWEKQMLKNIFVSLVFCSILTLTLFIIIPTKEIVAFATCISFYFWTMRAVKYYKKNGDCENRVIYADGLICSIYIASNMIFGYSLLSFGVTFVTILLFLIWRRNQTIMLYKELHAKMLGE